MWLARITYSFILSQSQYWCRAWKSNYIYIRFFLVEPKFVKQGKENKSLGRSRAGLVFFPGDALLKYKASSFMIPNPTSAQSQEEWIYPLSFLTRDFYKNSLIENRRQNQNFFKSSSAWHPSPSLPPTMDVGGQVYVGSSLSVTLVARVFGILAIILMLVWLLHYRGGLEYDSEDPNRVFNVRIHLFPNDVCLFHFML